MRRLVFGVASILLLTPIAPAATSIVPPSFERLVAEADLVFEGEVIDVRSQFVNADGGQAITTDVSFRVVNVIKGSALPDCSVLGANSTLHKAFSQPYTLYSGVPAQPVAPLDPESGYFHRDIGFVP